MSLYQKVKKLRERLEDDDAKKTKALRRAKELAGKYHDVKPRTNIPSPERYMDLPEFSK